MTFSPFYMGNHTKPLDEFMQPSSYTLAENWGFQVNFMVPLDKTGYKQCKKMAKRYEEKMKLEYEITRAHKCADLMKKGFMYRPCLLYTSPSPRDATLSRMPSSA